MVHIGNLLTYEAPPPPPPSRSETPVPPVALSQMNESKWQGQKYVFSSDMAKNIRGGKIFVLASFSKKAMAKMFYN